MTTLAQFRQNRLNVDLGLDLTLGTSGDGDNSFGTTSVRNQAIKVGFARLWPRMARLVVESLVPSSVAAEYTGLTTVRDVASVNLLDTTGDPYSNDVDSFRFLFLETTPGSPQRRLRLPAAFPSGDVSSIRVIGYTPYKSEFTGDADTLDIPEEFEWVACIGARAEIYRRQLNERINYERFNTLNRDNDVTVQELFTVYQMATREFDDAITSHQRSFITGHSASFRT